jgi:hypothetical protein
VRDSKKIHKKIAFLEDEKDDEDEIVIKGIIKKSSLKGVHQYLKDEEGDCGAISPESHQSKEMK